MSLYPEAQKLLLPENQSQPRIVPTQFLIHSLAAPWTVQRTYEYWRDSTSLESHFAVDYTGHVGQFVDTEVRADANAGANRRADGTGAVSVETSSNLENSDPWNSLQLSSLIRLGVWLHREHGIPLRVCQAHDDPGYGYHRMYPQWSTSGTACPGDTRVQQFHNYVFPEIVRQAASDQEEDLPAHLHLSISEPMTLVTDQWASVRFDVEHNDPDNSHGDGAFTFLGGPAKYVGTCAMEFSGIGVNGQVMARIVEDDSSGDIVSMDIPDERRGTITNTYMVFPMSDWVGPGRRVKIQVQATGAGSPALVRAVLKLHVWPE